MIFLYIVIWIAIGIFASGIIKYDIVKTFPEQDDGWDNPSSFFFIAGPLNLVAVFLYMLSHKVNNQEINIGWMNPFKNYKGKVR